ncbi:stage V sporulation protein B [Alicyclobacillus cycloheptanicus]|uniref:Stage V sporulation protein B n=1 Tax=Alicyclobacillus cycloheptanicus TaxID=1457 RepID=A0ABT9XEV7_9BACL|nr:stage V sporulation protein B [Alicyclobacillus cycloheptanicus]MDQ0188732.1 stage V sporulation protein B [Alicyclobacillus cycloheptanicus]WDM00606.1 stage V sporulation protein B [Alicyclobacillus cycloheptanicus]
MTQRSFLRGAVVLMAASLTTRIMGFIYRIFLTRIIGAQGMGLFQIVFPLLSLVLTFVTAGLPVAISKLVAEAIVQNDRVRVQRILRVSTAVIGTMAVVFTVLMWVLRGFVRTHWLTDPRAYPTYLAMIPIVAVIAVSSIFRGYFQGLQDMAPPAWASIVEQTVRIASVWILAAYFVQFSLAYAAAGAMIGMLLGELSGMLFLVVSYRRRGRLSMVLPNAPMRSLETVRQTLRAIVDIAGPVTLSRLIWSLIYAIEPVLVARSLWMAGIGKHAATALYGQYGGMALPLLVFPTVITGSLAVNLVPSVSEAMAGETRDDRRVRLRVAQSWRVTALVGFPATVILSLLATPLCAAIYHEPAVGRILAIMAPAGFLLYLQAPLAGVLQGLNKAGLAMMNSIAGGLLRLVLIYVLASRPSLGIYGVALATTVSFCVTTALQFMCIVHFVGFPIRLWDTAKIAAAALACLLALTVMIRDHAHIAGLHLLAAIVFAILLDFFLLCAFRVLTTQNVRRVPRVGRILATIVSAIPFAV